MRIQHNMMAINANRNLGNNNSALGKTLEKLSSGFKINRAGDNAAGLAISEKMRAQITCLSQAETNCNDGVSLIQTAEGALQEVHSMLNRLTELCEQSANGTYDDAVDRNALQSEVRQLVSEIDRISSATNFNGITLLNGRLGGYALTLPATMPANLSGVDASGGGLTVDSEFKVQLSNTATNAPSITLSDLKLNSTDTASTAAACGIGFTSAGVTAKKVGTITYYTATLAYTEPAAATDQQKAIGKAYDGVTITVKATGDVAASQVQVGKDVDGNGTEDISAGMKLQIGDTSDDYNQLTILITDMSSYGMKYTDPSNNVFTVHDIDISTLDGAVAGMAVAKNAINYVSSQRGTLGAMQNRLEHTINNLSTTNENITNAESRIRDTDMAAEMMTYTSKSILSQAAQSMLAQANQVPQQVLSLLQ